MAKQKQVSISISKIFLAIVVLIVFYVGYTFFLNWQSGGIANIVLPTSQPTPVSKIESWNATPMEHPTLYSDASKGVSFDYPKDTFVVKTDSEVDLNRSTNSNIPTSFTKMKGYSSPKVLWALKVESLHSSQGRYGEKINQTPFSVWVFENPEKINIQRWFDKYWFYPFTWGSAIQSEIEKMRPVVFPMIDGQLSFGSDMGSSPSGYETFVYVQRGNKIFLFQTLESSMNESLGSQIVNSFKFLPESK